MKQLLLGEFAQADDIHFRHLLFFMLMKDGTVRNGVFTGYCAVKTEVSRLAFQPAWPGEGVGGGIARLVLLYLLPGDEAPIAGVHDHKPPVSHGLLVRPGFLISPIEPEVAGHIGAEGYREAVKSVLLL
ncbi:hypothetical protein ES705_37834 [subsurface metagenome]